MNETKQDKCDPTGEDGNPGQKESESNQDYQKLEEEMEEKTRKHKRYWDENEKRIRQENKKHLIGQHNYALTYHDVNADKIFDKVFRKEQGALSWAHRNRRLMDEYMPVIRIWPLHEEQGRGLISTEDLKCIDITMIDPSARKRKNNRKEKKVVFQGNGVFDTGADIASVPYHPQSSKQLIHSMTTEVEQWSNDNKLQLNAEKCKEMIIDFKKAKQQFDCISVNAKDLERVTSAKILGLTISNSLLWVDHITDVIKKANKRLYFLILLKRSNVPVRDLIQFYCTCIRPVLEYCAPVFHHALPGYLNDDLERIQKRALSIISSELSYTDNLTTHQCSTLKVRRQKLCNKLFETVVSDTDRKLYPLLPPKIIPLHNLRKQRTFDRPPTRTNRSKNSFILSMSKEYYN